MTRLERGTSRFLNYWLLNITCWMILIGLPLGLLSLISPWLALLFVAVVCSAISPDRKRA